MVVTVKGAVAVVAVPAIASLLGIIWFQRKRQKHLSSSDRSEKCPVDAASIDGSNHLMESSDSFDSGKVSQPESRLSQEMENESDWISTDDNATPESIKTPEFSEESSRRDCVDEELLEHCLTDKCGQVLSYDFHLSMEDKISSDYGSMSLTSVKDIRCDECFLGGELENPLPGNTLGLFSGDNFAAGSIEYESKNTAMQCTQCINESNPLLGPNVANENEMLAPSGEQNADPAVDITTLKSTDEERAGGFTENLDECRAFHFEKNSGESSSTDVLENSHECGVLSGSLGDGNSVVEPENSGMEFMVKDTQTFNNLEDALSSEFPCYLQSSTCNALSSDAVCMGSVQQELMIPLYNENDSASYFLTEDSCSIASHSSAVLDYGVDATSSFDDLQVSQFYNFVREFELPSHLCGILIGKNGKTIKRVSKRTRTLITVQLHPSKEDCKVIYIRGCNGEDVEEAFATIAGMFPDEELHWPEYIYAPTFHQGIGNIDNATVLVVSIVTANHVFLQVPEQVQEVAFLTQAMSYFYTCNVGQPLDVPVSERTLCAASLGGSNWFRAEVVESYFDRNSCVLKFVDVGGYAMTDVSHLRKLRDDFMAVPYQATECYLYDVLPPNGEEMFRYGTVTFLEGMVRGVQLMCKVNCYADDGVPCVTLCVFHSDMMVNVNQQLIAHGYAVSS